MHRALFLPEIIKIILETESSSPGFLHTCLLISKTFSLEATRMLWYACGAYYPPEVYSHVTPDIKHLAQIAIEDVRRAQYYANFIHVLSFYQEETREDSEEEDYDIDFEPEEIKWHKELVSLQFPQLEDFTLFKDGHQGGMKTEDIITHFAQPNIKEFRVHEGDGLSDSLFHKLAHSCPRLKVLELSNMDESNVSEDTLVQFLTKADTLTWLAIRTALHGGWYDKAFLATARLPNLSHIAIPDIQDTWLDSIRQMNSSTPIFPSLKELETGISDHNLECLVRYLPNLELLDIDLEDLPPSHNILASASNFINLTSLTVKFSRKSSISSNDLLLLVQNCPSLDRLALGQPRSTNFPRSELDITDSTIDEVAQILGTRILSLVIVLDRPTLLTWRSVCSLARYCKNLVGLTISCNFNWQNSLSSTPRHIFPALEQLEFVFDMVIRHMQPLRDLDLDTVEVGAERIFSLAPKLSNFWIEDGNINDNDLRKAVMDIVDLRNPDTDED
ncbi:hypothetical protein DSL72_005233 [Monilinia vaccinii-corymbosi]|uniref:F-box domain-containing protein n=1 Tax=Monilinia vaccinii-corymbosi TaxID=61207 RepID=A0A8A3PF23_9HELO|nr:hypothetical protein DSL72_005233 [Monilinia vaccinii-corymbosi]